MVILFFYYLFLSLSPIFFARLTARIVSLKFGLIFLGVLIYLPYFFTSYGILDIKLFESVGYYAWNRADIYYYDADHRLYPYFPLNLFITGAVFGLSNFLQMNFLTLWRAIVLLCLLNLIFWIKKILIQKKSKDIKKKSLIFLFSPITLFPVLFHGHPDVILLMFYVGGVWLVYFQRNLILGSVSFGLSILTKTWSLVFLPLFLLSQQKPQRRIFVFFIPVLLILFVCAFYIRFWHSNPIRLLNAVSGYSGSWVVFWGPQGFLGLFNIDANFRLAYNLVLFSFGYFIVLRKKMDILDGSLFLILTFFVFTISFAPQYIFWIWPLIVLCEKLETIRKLSVFSIPYVFLSYADLVWNLRLNYLIVLSSLPFWYLLFSLWYTKAHENLHEIGRLGRNLAFWGQKSR